MFNPTTKRYECHRLEYCRISWFSSIRWLIIFLGSAQSGGRLCDQVTSLGYNTVTHGVEIINPIDVFGPGNALSHSGAELRLPTHFGLDLALGPKDVGIT